MLYRILTENKNLDNVKKLAAAHFDGFTIYKAVGYWKGNEEESLVIEIWAQEKDEAMVRALAEKIKVINSQESVLIQELSGTGYFV